MNSTPLQRAQIATPNRYLTQHEQQQIETLGRNSRKIREWLATSKEKTNRRGEPLKSNLTDNDSATMKTSHGIVQGYTGVAAVDAKSQPEPSDRSAAQSAVHQGRARRESTAAAAAGTVGDEPEPEWHDDA
ncbi:hypothetical protein [Nevskia sp.]|uniref:hypothetical protein n=1 Tax=Nevskia sp. TaxID=1929292 RepID=UPI003F705A20